jgi:hypothetical protein
MNSRTPSPLWLTFVVAVSLTTACESMSSLTVAEGEPSSTTNEVAQAEPVTEAEPTSQPTPPLTGDCAPLEELAAMDNRISVPLQPMMAWHQKQNMMEHLVAIQLITDGLAREDWQAIGDAATQIGSSPQMQQMCQHMGAGAPGFTELALEFHSRADGIGRAARERDARGVLEATSSTLQACTSCHLTYRQEVVSADAWQERTGSANDPGAMHGH